MKRFIEDIQSKWGWLYITGILFFYSLIISLAYMANIRNSQDIHIFWLIYGAVIAFPIAENFSFTFFSLLIKNNFVEPPRLNSLYRNPKVALLYCTCDDFVPEAIMNLDNQDYRNLEIFILDDSREYEQIKNIDSYKHLNIIRRHTRKGFKAGNLNNWIVTNGNGFDYFVILDSDSIIPPNFVRTMLLFAEHPDNMDVIFFESKILGWEPKTLLQKTLSTQMQIAGGISWMTNNLLGSTLSNGHNNLCRTQPLQKLGGFNENFISEDHATTLDIIAENYKCLSVNVESYEILPIGINSLKKRLDKWIRNDFQLIKHPWNNVPLTLQIKLILRPLTYLLWFPILFTMVFTLWKYESNITDIVNFFNFLLRSNGYIHPQVWPVLSIFGIIFLYLYLLRYPFAASQNIKFSHYLGATFITICLDFSNIYTTLLAITRIITRKKFEFVVTPKKPKIFNMIKFLKSNWFIILLSLIFIISVPRNLAILVFNWPWIIPLILSPLILWWAEMYPKQEM